MIEITKTCEAGFMKARNYLVVRCRETGKKAEDGENVFFKALGNRFWLISKSYSWFIKIVYGGPSTKWTS